mmetsp:Transcript_22368/g.43843  ORF Transcript_22368/g.43843 Transcript_22368/m.43843 type:complete len:407 (+) Transcript_22368:457-1677(+)
MGQSGSVSEYATVRVALDQTLAVPGDVVEGHISAVVIARTKLSEVIARLRCTVVTGADTDQGKAVLVDQLITCKKYPQGYLDPGTYHFPFRFHLPRDAPPSVNFEHLDRSSGDLVKLCVAYSVNAEIRIPSWFGGKQVLHKQPLEVNATPAIAPISTSRMIAKVDSGFAFLRTHGGIHVNAFCIPSCVRPGETCAVTVHMYNNTNAAFVLRQTKLEQTIRVQTRLLSKEHTQKWTLHQSTTVETEEEYKDPNDDSEVKVQRVPPKETEFGAQGKKTCARFTITVPLNIPHQSFSIKQASINHAVVFTLQPCALLGSTYNLRLPLQIAHSGGNSHASRSATVGASSQVARAVHASDFYGDDADVPLAMPVPAPSAPPLPNADSGSSLTSSLRADLTANTVSSSGSKM